MIGDEFRRNYLSDPEAPNVFRCRVIVFDGPEDYHSRIDDPSLEIDRNTMLVIRNCGPVGYPGSAEVVNMLPPRRLIEAGIRELPCMGDGRQSGTSASPSILNVSPEAAVGGGLALLEDGDWVRVDLNINRVMLELDEDELNARRSRFVQPQLTNQTPWQEIYRRTVGQLGEGAVMELDEQHIRLLERHGTPRHSH